MRNALPWVGALALSALGACGRRAETRRRAPRPQPELAAEAPLPPREAASPVAGAAPPIAHPNADARDEALGQRVSARPLPIPRLALGRSAAFTFDGGRRGWALQLSQQQLITPAYAQGKVFVGAGFASTTVYALDAHTGALKWQADTPDGGPTGAIVEDGEVLFNTESCTLFAFDVRTGRQRWSRYLGDPLMSAPAAARGRAFTAWPDGDSPTGFSFGALRMRDGAVAWHHPVPADVMTAPVIVGDAVYLTAMNGVVQRWNARNGRRVWSRAISATSAPAVDGARVYVAQRAPGGRERQVALDAGTGATVSRADPTRAAYARQRPDTGGTEAGWAWEGSRPAYADGRVYTAMGDSVVARDVATGSEVWRKRNPMGGSARGVTSPAVVGSQLVVGTRGGDVFGLDIDTGETTWAWRVGEPIVFQPAVAEGWVYVATQRGKVVGFEVGDASVDGWHMWGGNAQHAGLTPSTPSTVDDPPRSGVLRSTGRDGAPMPLLHADVSASVEGPVARVVVEQTFTNPHTRAVDAEYLLPLPENAAVDAMELRVGERVIRADIQRRDDARRAFASARARGRTAALLEQQRPNLFRQSVANVRPGESVRVRVSLAQTVAWREGRYELVLPLNPGSRYTPGQGGAAPDRSPGDVTLRARIDLGVALAEVSSPSHPVTVRGDGSAREVTLPSAVTPDRDFVLRYRPVAEVAATAALAARGPDGGYLSLQLLPAVELGDDRVTPRELVFVVDTSSSMRGRPLALAQAVVREALAHARPDDTVRVLRFSDAVAALDANPLPATPENLARARGFVDAMRAAGETEMLPGLRAALAGRADERRVRVVVLLTDGYIGDESEVMAAVRPALGVARVFALGVGGAVNRYLLEGVAEEGRGEAMVVTPSEDPAEAARRFHAMIARPVLTDVEVDWGGLAVTDVYPRVVPDLFADRPLVVQARYARGGEGTVRVRARLRGRRWEQAVRVTLPDAGTSATEAQAAALPSLWARARVKDLSRALLLGETPAIRDAITEVGLRHHLVTAYTSFVAVDEGAVAQPTTRVVHRGASVGTSSVGYGALGGAIPRAVDRPITLSDALLGAAAARPTAEPSPAPARIDAAAQTGRVVASAPRDVVSALAPRLRAIVAAQSRATPGSRGQVVLRVTFDATGDAREVSVVGDSLGAQRVTAALRRALLQARAEAGAEGRVVTVRAAVSDAGAMIRVE